MRVLVTGGTGFLGTHLVRRLLAEGIYVRILARPTARAESLVTSGAEWVHGDITNARAVRAALAGVGVVYHLAGKLYMPGTPPTEYEHIHVDGTRTLLACACEQETIPRLVHCSTTGVLGVTGDVPAGEETLYHPTNAYERTKRDAEILVHAAARQHGLPAVIVRPGLVYGPGDLHLLGFFRAIQSRLFRPLGYRPVWLHPIYIADMTEAFVRCGLDARAVGECFHIAGSEPTTICMLAEVIAATLDVPAPRGAIPLPLAQAVAALGDALPVRLRQRAPLTQSRLDFLTHSRVYDVTKAQRLLEFSAQTPLPAGIAMTTSWYLSKEHLSPRSTGRSRWGAHSAHS